MKKAGDRPGFFCGNITGPVQTNREDQATSSRNTWSNA